MDDAAIQALVRDHYAAAGSDETHVGSIYSDDAILDFPQGGERIRGRANIIAFRSVYPAHISLEIPRTVGSGDVWVNEGIIRYDGQPQRLVSIWEFKGDRLIHETAYVAEPWDPPKWRAQWVEPMPEDRD